MLLPIFRMDDEKKMESIRRFIGTQRDKNIISKIKKAHGM